MGKAAKKSSDLKLEVADPWTPWTVVHKGTFDPVLPCDGNEHEDEGMLVYRSRAAAEIAAKHQSGLWEGVKAVALPLSAVILHETQFGRAPIPPTRVDAKKKSVMGRAVGLKTV